MLRKGSVSGHLQNRCKMKEALLLQHLLASKAELALWVHVGVKGGPAYPQLLAQVRDRGFSVLHRRHSQAELSLVHLGLPPTNTAPCPCGS